MANIDFIIGQESFKLSATEIDGSFVVKVGDKDFRLVVVGENLYSCMVDGTSYLAAVIKHKEVIYVDIAGTVIEVQEASAVQNSASAHSHHAVKDKVFAPMPGKIVKIMVNKGDAVSSRQPLAIVEAMKMENQIISPSDGKVKAVNFSVGDQVNTTSPIIELELAAGQ
ncbi:MAG: biotin/lipoyl-containing protein [Candidatus Zixiibacteriota bacterium]